jgi:ATP-dependent Clp protease ATP-binding subunit ClpC
LVILGESTPAEFNRGLGRNPELQRLFDRYLLPEASNEDTRTILRSFRDEAGAEVSDEMLDRVLELATHYLGSLARPGNAMGLLRQVLAAHGGLPVEPRHLLETLSKSTGVPADLLDDAVPLDAVAARRFFEARVMGQPEAVEAVVDVVTLIKAGLTDPLKPFGVFLFIGPTGVGKTELARALAEFIFGDAKRLVRLDMSEFASVEGFERLLGTPGRPGLLTEPVRLQPFSVVLLDEIEKSHVNVFDLCLQLFDAGRLTDGQGRTVDFRRTIVILTSNIGATAPQLAQMGFGPRAEPAASEPDREKTLRELNRFFRPEFLNRLDRVVNFRPLGLEVAHEIARKEVALVLGRSGIARRHLAIDVDESVLALLVKEGYSPHFGARPLKRAVEKHVLLPLGRIIAAGRIGEGRVLRLALTEGRLEVVPVREPAKVAAAAPPGATDSPELMARAEELLRQCASLEESARPLADRKSELLSQTALPGFYEDARRRAETFDEVHRLDQFLGQCYHLRQAVEGLRSRLGGGNLRELDRMQLGTKCGTLEVELAQLSEVAGSRNALELGDALLHLELVTRTGTAVEAVSTLVKMYLGFAARRRLEVEVLAERYEGQKDEVYLLCAGLGAFGWLRSETGFHQFDRRYRENSKRGGRQKQREDRELVKVRVIPAAGEPERRFVSGLTKRVASLPLARSRLIRKAGLEVSLMDPGSMLSISGWMAGTREAGIERLARCLHWLAAPTGQVKEADLSGVVRQYDLGITPRVKDTRSGRSTTRIERVLKGQLELLAGVVTSEGEAVGSDRRPTD